MDSFSGLSKVWIRSIKGKTKMWPLEWVKSHPRGVLLKIEGLNNPADVRPLIGSEVGVPRSSLPDLNEGEYYWVDLIGLEAIKESGYRLGKVKAIFETKAHDVLVVESEGEEVLIPAIESVVADVDIEQGFLIIKDIEDLDS
jgi:16S rRNA processing protein RimM